MPQDSSPEPKPNTGLNSKRYWNHRFRVDWEDKGGRKQSEEFMTLLFGALPFTIRETILAERLSILDCGCAEGDGTAVLEKSFPESSVSGFDFSHEAIKRARDRYPELSFFVEDFYSLDEARGADVLISSHCMEHLERPIAALRRLLACAQRYAIILVPFLESHPLFEEHLWTIHAASYPEALDDWSMTHRIALPPSGAWWGPQLLLVYQPRDQADPESLPPVPTTEAISLEHELRSLESTCGRISPLLDRALSLAQDPHEDREEIVRTLTHSLHSLRHQVAVAYEQVKSLERSLIAKDQEVISLRSLSQVHPQGPIQERDENGLVQEQQTAKDQEAERELQHLRGTLRTISDSRSWRLVTLHWNFRNWLRLKGRTRSLLRRLVPLRQRRWLKRLSARFGQRTLYEQSFHSYKVSRSAAYPRHPDSLRAPVTRGLVSIVLPVYNGEDYLREALDSCLEQTFEQFELIVIDDGSTDGTPSILSEYQGRDSRIQVYSQENAGLPRALSAGFRRCKGEFLTWTSADNRLKPKFLERLVDCLARHPDWDMVFANVDIIGEDGNPLLGSPWYSGYQIPPGSEHVHLPRNVAALNVWPNNYVGAAFLYRYQTAALIGDYSPHRFGTEDYDYWMRVNSLLTLRHADFSRSIYDYRFHSQSLTARDEELGITRSRVQLMVFEEFRRDLYLTPMVWVIDSPDDGSAGKVKETLLRTIQQAGHKIHSSENLCSAEIAHCWIPYVHVTITEDPAAQTAGEALPGAPFRVLVSTSGDSFPDPVDSNWDLCLAASAPAGELPALSGDYRGWFAATDTGTLFTAIDIRVKARQARLIEDESTLQGTLDASVIICTYSPDERLHRAVAAVAAQDYPLEKFEVLVVDNSPRNCELVDEVESLRERHFSSLPDHLRLVHCPLLGLSHARNAGISEARGEILCFLDDDSLAQPDWLKSVLNAFESHPDAGVIGGLIDLKTPEPPPPVVGPGWKRYWSHFTPGYSDYTVVRFWWEYPWGANWNARRRALWEIGGFRGRYGRRAKNFSGGEEIIASSLVQRIGYEIAVEPAARVIHDVQESRFSYHHVRRTIIAGTLINYLAQRDLYIPRETSLRRTLLQLLSPRVDRTVGANSRAARIRHWLYRKEAWLRLLVLQVSDLFKRLRLTQP